VPGFLTISLVTVAPVGPGVTISGQTITINVGTLAPTDVYTVTITTVVNSSATPPGGPNNVALTTSSTDSDPTNNVDSAEITIVAPSSVLPSTGFAPGRLTRLPPQPANRAYSDDGDLWLEIPDLGVSAAIVGVPRVGGQWDVSWLSTDVGYLVGTAFPTWSGNSLLTAHVTLPSGLPGPFADLAGLQYGDRVIVHAWGLHHVYEIQDVELVSPFDREVMRHEDQPWVTLITCQGYDERAQTYRWRVAARAVLVNVQLEKPRSEDRLFLKSVR
jgi:LPXTG-site transpeptidase (sortase) family protein